MAGGTAPDLFYLRPDAILQQLFEKGQLAPLADLPGLKESFDPPPVAPWATDAGVPNGVRLSPRRPGYIRLAVGLGASFIAAKEPVKDVRQRLRGYAAAYNRHLFHKLTPTVPETWEQLLAMAKAIKAAGYIPFANASGEKWTMGEIVVMNLAPNFIGGREGRLGGLGMYPSLKISSRLLGGVSLRFPPRPASRPTLPFNWMPAQA